MRVCICFILLLLSNTLFAQEKNSLLWEISGNGLQESSYLYGTMHVSKKIAFRLDDVFYEALDKSEVVALESNPETWLEDTSTMQRRYGNTNTRIPKGFYFKKFMVKNPTKEDIGAYLAFEDQMINNILYRTNEFAQNFEEETYLDMFIYQAGKKFSKPIVALEDLEESSALVGRASLNAMKEKPDEWLQKKLQQEDPFILMQDAYRERNIALLDSLDQAMYTEHYLKNMLYQRNENMVKRLDSVMHKSKVFTGIGAAHLPGTKGVIAMLRDKGYIVKPLLSKISKKGQQLKEKFENKIRENSYDVVAPDDALFSLTLHNKLYPVGEYINTSYISPDLANGGYFMINRIPTFAFLKQDDTFTLDDIDDLLFENIPGKITDKKRIKTGLFEGIDLNNKLKNGDHQRYHIYKTPLEIIIFKMAGEGDYTARYSDTIFNSIAFKKIPSEMVTVSSDYCDFDIQMPAYHTFTNKKRKGPRYIEGYDEKSKSYYFLRKENLHDLTFIEEDTFELKQIQKRFYQGLEVKGTYGTPINNSLTSSAILDSVSGEKLHLKTVIRGSEYYLMGTKTTDSLKAKSFFDSFSLKAIKYKAAFEKIQDTALFFSTVSSVKPPKFANNSNLNYGTRKNEIKDYNAYMKKTVYENENNEKISVTVNKAHDYLMFPTIDSVWALRKEIYAKNKFLVYKESQKTAPEGYHELQLTLLDTASSRGIRIKNVIKGGLLYEVRAVVDTLHQPSVFVTEFFDHFVPADTLIGKNILTDKTTEFFKALTANDSIVLEGHTLINFQKKHIDSLKHYITAFDYKDNQREIQGHLLRQLSSLNAPDMDAFLSDFYNRSYSNAEAQFTILRELAKKQDEASGELLLSLMRDDLPLASGNLKTYMLFKPYLDSLELAKKLYPEILDYSSISEYKSPIFTMLSRLKAEGMVKPKIYKKYRKQLLNDAKIQLKRQLGQQNSANNNRSFNNNRSLGNSLLEDYVILLYPYRAEKETRQFFHRLRQLTDPKVQTTYMALLAENDVPIPNGVLDSLAADINSRSLLFQKLKDKKKLALFPSKYNNARALAEASMYKFKRFKAEEDSIVFLAEKPLDYRGKKLTGYYFKTKQKQGYNKDFKLYLILYENGVPLEAKPFYKSKSTRIKDTETDEEIIKIAAEKFLLKDRNRAAVYKPNQQSAYYGY